ncbi:MAG TPA: EAL domain-containing protein [Acidobacteriaceae bacterium]|jgi:PAS domain S-box-containing protein|nr:EAL domain-containing protein [Acidobacteriaceae bacterium]
MRSDAANIARALENDEFFPVFQPLVELKTGQLTGVELLARWQHPVSGVIAPDVFIPQVEISGLSNRLTQKLLESAFASVPLVASGLVLSVNLSALQLQDADLPSLIAACAERGAFPPDRLTIEVTESALLDDLARAKDVARRLKDLGCSLALDDFGTGYSSLRHLQALPFDKLKVDRSFVRSMTAARESRKIVAAVVGLGQSLGLMTIAEGVETQAQANMLLWLGCDLGQGWLYGKPAPAGEIPRMLSGVPQTFASFLPAHIEGSSVMTADLPPAQRLAQLQAIYDGAPVGLCFLDRNLRYLSLNRRLAVMNGSPVTAHLGKTVGEVIPRMFPMVEPLIRRALAGEPISGVEMQKPMPDDSGQAETVLLSYQPARDEAGEIVGVSMAVMDVSERKRAEQALRESESHYRHMMQLNPHVPWVLDAQGAVIEASSRWESVTGQTMDRALGDGWVQMLHPDDVESTLEAIRHSLRTGHAIDVNYRVRTPEGQWKWMRSRGSPRFDGAGKIVSIYGVVEEVHEQRQIGNELKTCQAELEAVLELVPMGLIVANAAEATIHAVNPAAKRLLGDAFFPGQYLLEHNWEGPSDAPGRPLTRHENLLARAILGGEAVESLPLDYRSADGTLAQLVLAGKPVFAEGGQLVGALMIVLERASAKEAVAII